MAWDEAAGRVSSSFDEWLLVERDIGAFMRLALRIARDFYDRTWEEVSTRPSDGEGPGLPDVFEDEVEGLYGEEFEWMLLAGVVKDAVTAFEVYLEKAADEALTWHHEPPLRRARGEESPRWGKIRAFYERLGVDLSEVRDVRRLRHLLTHQRGELRTEERRAAWGSDEDGRPDLEVRLTEERTASAVDALAEVARRGDREVYRVTWGGDALPPQVTRASG